MKAKDIARKLKEIRTAKGLTQDAVAQQIDISVSQISRIEAGQRGLAIDRLGPWSRALGYRAEIMLWASSPSEPDTDVLTGALDDEAIEVLRQVAGTLPRMSPDARASIVQLLGLWRAEAGAETEEGKSPDE